MGSRPNITRKKFNIAYIAGFLDGDGSVMLQLKKRSDSKSGYRFMCTICFYQDSRHDKPLRWIRQQLQIGYIFMRNDGMTELRINGYDQCAQILQRLQPYVRFKRVQVDAMLNALTVLKSKGFSHLSVRDKRKLIRCMLLIQQHNYQSSGKRTQIQLEKMLCLTP